MSTWSCACTARMDWSAWMSAAARPRIQVRGGAAEALEPLPEADRTPEWAPAHDLVNVVLGRGTSGSPASLGVAAVELVDAMYRSAATRRPVRIDQIE